MSNVGQLTFDFSLNLSMFDQAIAKAGAKLEEIGKSFTTLKNNAQKDIDNISSSFPKIQKSAEDFGKKMSLFATLPIVGLGVAAAKSAGEFELMEASFTSMLGSAEDAKKLMIDIKNVAAATPYGAQEISKVVQLMLGVNQTATESMEIFNMLGDVAQGNAARMNGIAIAYSQIMAAGRANGQDMMQLLNNQVPIWNELAKVTGKSQSELRKMSEQGLLSSELVKKAFQGMTAEGGLFFKGMENGSKTLPGLLSTLSDTVGELGRTLLEGLMPTIKSVVKEMTSWAESFSQMSETGKTFVLVLLGIVAAIGPIVSGITTAIKAYQGLSIAINFVKTSAVAAQIATALLNATIAAGPWLLAAAAIAGVSHAVYELVKAEETQVRTQEQVNKGFADLTATFEKQGKTIPQITKELESQKAMFQGLANDAQKFKNQIAYDDNIKSVNALTKQIESLRQKQAQLEAADPTKQKAKAASEEWVKMWKDAQAKYTKLIEESGKTKLEMIELEYNRDVAALEQANARKLLSEKQYQESRAALQVSYEQKRNQEALSISTNVMSATSQGLTDISNLFAMADQNRQLQIDNRLNREMEAIAMQYDTEKAAIEGSVLTQEQKDEKLKALDEKRARDEKAIQEKAAKEKRKLEREAAKRSKEIAIVDTIITTATAAIKAYESMLSIPIVGSVLGAIAAAAVTAFGMAKLALIQQQPLPAAAEGGYFTSPYITGEAGPEVAFPLSGPQGRAALQGLTDALLISLSERGKTEPTPGTIVQPVEQAGQMLHTQIYIGDDLLYDNITRATDDGKIKVNARSVVS